MSIKMVLEMVKECRRAQQKVNFLIDEAYKEYHKLDKSDLLMEDMLELLSELGNLEDDMLRCRLDVDDVE